MPNRVKRYYWDANVFITLISNLGTPQAIADRENCTLIVQSAMDGETQIYTSTLTIAEVLDTQENLTKPVPPNIRQIVRELFEEPYITLIAVDTARTSEARELRWEYPWLRTVDAIHVVSAVYAKIDEMHTYDGRGSKRGILSLNRRVGKPPLKIVVPGYEGVLSMF